MKNKLVDYFMPYLASFFDAMSGVKKRCQIWHKIKLAIDNFDIGHYINPIKREFLCPFIL